MLCDNLHDILYRVKFILTQKVYNEHHKMNNTAMPVSQKVCRNIPLHMVDMLHSHMKQSLEQS